MCCIHKPLQIVPGVFVFVDPLLLYCLTDGHFCYFAKVNIMKFNYGTENDSVGKVVELNPLKKITLQWIPRLQFLRLNMKASHLAMDWEHL